MLKLTFNQTRSELMVRAAATILFNSLTRNRTNEVRIGELAEHPQYGFTASATAEPVGPKFVRITDLQDGKIDWKHVPFCECLEPEKYLLQDNDILFARTGATTGKTHLVRNNPGASVFASYLIRLRPKPTVEAGYLHAFFQSENYWSQIAEEKEGSAQPNVNGEKLIALKIPFVERDLQVAIAEFLTRVRHRQDGQPVELPELPGPLAEQRRIVARIEELAAKINEARGLRQEIAAETTGVSAAVYRSAFSAQSASATIGNVCEVIDPNPSHRYPVYVPGGVPIVSSSEFRGDDDIDPTSAKRVPESFYNETLGRYAVGEGDVIFSRKGKVGYARPHPRGVSLAMTHTLCVMKPDRHRVDPRYLLHFARSPFFLRELTGTMNPNVGVPTLGLQVIRNARIPLGSLSEQRCIAARLDSLCLYVDTLKKIQAGSAAELDALLPSILDKAFNGPL